ncbi:uncharacterized protein LOC117571428 isoform X1 [Drosophila albomicans]|uniref:Uncharacterized protein LOC117571428 isoform X1 n=1 Tax=Drosophila albomicans TaxID=7291 RepID=A0A6P8X9V6_DROAB|nr:uncharacterized protein LOC117571428 isoform X1 [Drosophila albomicans]
MCFLGCKTLKINSLISAVFLMGCNIVETGVGIEHLRRAVKGASFLITSIMLNLYTVSVIALGMYGVIITNLKILRIFMVTLVVYFLGKLFLSVIVDHLEQQEYKQILTPFYTIDAIFCLVELSFLGFYYSAVKSTEKPEIDINVNKYVENNCKAFKTDKLL